MKWFHNAHDGFDDMRRETIALQSQYDAPPERQKKLNPARLSATFTDARPWNFITTSQSSDRSSLSSRKRRSLFGNRGSSTSSDIPPADTLTQGYASPRPSFSAHTAARDGHRLGDSDVASSSRISLAEPDDWRSSIFSKRASTRFAKAGEELARYGNNVRSSMDFRRKDDMTEEAFYRKLKMNSISAPFNFQHISHTPRSQLPALHSINESGLQPDSSAASAGEQHQHYLRESNGQSVDENFQESEQELDTKPASEQFVFQRGPLAGMSPSFDHGQGSANACDVDAITPVSEARLSMFRDREERSRTLTRHRMSSSERLVSRGLEQREPPAMVHPAFRGHGAQASDIRSQSSGVGSELAAMSLGSVPEEAEGSHTSPVRSPRGARVHTEASPYSSPMPVGTTAHHTKTVSFPIGNAFAQAHGRTATESLSGRHSDQTSSCGDGSAPSLTSGESSWENDVDLIYSVEAESTCDFDWASFSSSRQSSDGSQHRRDSTATSSLRANSMHDDSSVRPLSLRNSGKSSQGHDLFADFDGTSTSTSLFPAPKLSFPPSASRRHSAISVSNAELTSIPELSGACAVSSDDDDSTETLTDLPTSKHVRSASCVGRRPSAPKESVRWSIATPLCVPEELRSRRPTFTAKIKASLADQMFFSAPLFPPPATPLPKVPNFKSIGLLSPPMSPPMLSMPEFTTVRRPSSPGDRALLQAAGRIVQRGRHARPATPSRLSHVQNAKEASSRSFERNPTTSPKMESVQFKLSIFPTPPQSPAQQQCEEYPAWI